MLFNEIYGSYFSAVSDILKSAVKGELSIEKIYDVVAKKGFAESSINIPEKLVGGEWPLLTRDMSTPLKHKPSMPLTTMEKRWLRTLLDDPRIRLFGADDAGLEDVEPLFDRDRIVYFDRYSDGDPYEDEEYIKNFRIMLKAAVEKRSVEIVFCTARGDERIWTCMPEKIEYSSKDDKFRVQVTRNGRRDTINIGRIRDCRLTENADAGDMARADAETRERYLIAEIRDERNALERAMLHFSHLKKETVKPDEEHYVMKLFYDADDETEILIRVMEFGPMMKVTEPEAFVENIRDRLARQRRL